MPRSKTLMVMSVVGGTLGLAGIAGFLLRSYLRIRGGNVTEAPLLGVAILMLGFMLACWHPWKRSKRK